MTAKTIALPNLRRLFIPDPGFRIASVDLSGADAFVAAWECGGPFKRAFAKGAKIHVDTMREFYGQRALLQPDHKTEPEYTLCKNMFYGTLYVGKPPGIAASTGIPERVIARFQDWNFERFPDIRAWHRRTDEAIQTTGIITNAFGYRIKYFDRPKNLLPEAVNWIPQSTVALVTNKAMLRLKHELSWIQILLQVHDEIVFQYPHTRHTPSDLQLIRETLKITVPYSDPLIIPWGLKTSTKSWGDCEDTAWDLAA